MALRFDSTEPNEHVQIFLTALARPAHWPGFYVVMCVALARGEAVTILSSMPFSITLSASKRAQGLKPLLAMADLFAPSAPVFTL